MSDLVGNPEDRFSHVAAQMVLGAGYMSHDARKLVFGSFDLVQLKLACKVTEEG